MATTTTQTLDAIARAYNQFRAIVEMDIDDANTIYGVGRTHDFLEQAIKAIGKLEQKKVRELAELKPDGTLLRNDKGEMVWKEGESMASFAEHREILMEKTMDVNVHKVSIKTLLDKCVGIKPSHISSTHWCFIDDMTPDVPAVEEPSRREKREANEAA